MTDTLPLTSEIPSDNSEYMIRSGKEIAYILRAIQHKRELVTAYFNQGKDFILTSILAVDADQALILDFGPDEAVNQRMLSTGKIVLTTTQNGVKIQFAINGVAKVDYLGRPAFSARIPHELLKLQRREYYRLPTPIINPIKCSITFPQGGKAEVTIADISLGGIAITNYPTSIGLGISDRYSDCRILLPGTGTVSSSIEVRSQREITRKNGQVSYQAGCMFLDLPPGQEAIIQRYIIKLERERTANGPQ